MTLLSRVVFHIGQYCRRPESLPLGFGGDCLNAAFRISGERLQARINAEQGKRYIFCKIFKHLRVVYPYYTNRGFMQIGCLPHNSEVFNTERGNFNGKEIQE